MSFLGILLKSCWFTWNIVIYYWFITEYYWLLLICYWYTISSLDRRDTFVRCLLLPRKTLKHVLNVENMSMQLFTSHGCSSDPLLILPIVHNNATNIDQSKLLPSLRSIIQEETATYHLRQIITPQASHFHNSAPSTYAPANTATLLTFTSAEKDTNV